MLLSVILLAPVAHASPLNPWGAHVGEGVFALTPFLFVDQTPGAYPYVYAQYGLTDRAELLVGGGATIADGFSFDSVEVMPRFFFTDTSAFCLHANWLPSGGGAEIGPEYHGAYEMEAWSLSVNVGWSPWVGEGGFQAGSVFAMMAPEVYLTEATSLYLEIDPSLDLASGAGSGLDRLSVEVVPGVSTSVAETHYLAFGVALPVAPSFDTSGIYGGMWYSVAFGGE